MGENYIIRRAMARKDSLTAPLIKAYLQRDEMHVRAEVMEKRMSGLEGKQKAYELDMNRVKGKVVSFKAENFNCYSFIPGEKKSDKHIMYFCGGAFYQEATKYHIKFMETLSKRAGLKVTMIAYPKVPTYESVLSYKMTESAYKKILEETEAEKIILSGDSSGGALALTIPQYLKNKGLPLPGGIIVYSPACSIECNSPEAEKYQQKDPFVILDSVKIPVRYWRKTAGDIIADPMKTDFSILPDILMFSGSEEALYPDMKNFAEKIHDSGENIKYYIFEGMYHDFHLQYMTIAAKDAMKITCDFLGCGVL